jgi:hypothetical protein
MIPALKTLRPGFGGLIASESVLRHIFTSLASRRKHESEAYRNRPLLT